MIPTDPAERDAVAGEYVLGILEAAERAEIDRALPGDPALAAAIAAWEIHLAPLSRLAPPAAPPADLWDRIQALMKGAASVSPAPAVSTAPTSPSPASLADARARRGAAGIWRNAAIWRWSTLAATTGAACLALVVALRPAAPVGATFVALLEPPQSAAPAFMVEAADRGGVVLTAVRSAAVVTGRSLELWGAVPGAARPISLGVIPAEGRFVVDAHTFVLEDGLMLLVSQEPTGGSPTGLPTGPVVYAGRLTKTR